MRTLLISEVFPPKTGGSGRWFWEIYRRLPREEHVIAAGEHPKQDEFDKQHDLNLVRLPLEMATWGIASLAGCRAYWRAIRALRRVVRRERVGMIHCGRCLPEGLMALALKWWCGVPYLCYAHGEEVQYAADSRELGWLLRRVMCGAECIIANSQNTCRILTEKWQVAAERVHVLHPGVDTTRFVPAERDLKTRRLLGWDDRPVILTVGRLQKRKGHDRLIAALPEIRRALPAVRYAIVGDGEERPRLEALAHEFGVADAVQFLDEVDDGTMLKCYQQCDLFVLPNRQVGQDIEGFGIVLLEAQACGKPVVAGASGGTAETMEVPRSGRIVNCDGPNELACLVAELLGDSKLRGRMGASGRSWVVDRFDWASLSQQAQDVFGLKC
jgi:phosphatidyl-myo-inositol dimannoside synthase